MFLLVFGGHFVPLKGTPTWRLHTKLHKFGCRHQDAVEYNAGKSFFINFIEGKIRLDLTLFSIRRSQYFTSQTRSLLQRSPGTRHRRVQQKGHASPIFTPFPRNVSLVRLWFKSG